MSSTDNTIYVIGIDQSFLLEGVYDSMEEAIENINPLNSHTVQVYKTTMRELHRFYKEFTLYSIPDPNKYFKAHLTQVYPDPSNDYSLEDLAEELKQIDGHNNNDLNICPIYGVMMS